MQQYSREQMNIVIVGHVDHGKSTVIGRLLADTDTLPEGKLDSVRELCARNSKPFEYAFLIDALKDEMAQGITIDSARVFFKTDRRDYIIIDAPGHIEFLKNMVTGASRAEAALLVIDAAEGVQENSRRHGYLLSMLGIRHVAVLVNKMDLVDYDEQVFERIEKEYRTFLKEIEIEPDAFVPVSGMQGDNVASPGVNMPWHKGKTVLEQLDVFEKQASLSNLPFRMPVQGVYKFTHDGDNRRIVAGTVETGKMQQGDEVVFYPSGKRSRVRSLEAFNRPPQKSTEAGWAAAFTLDEQIYITRGEIAALEGEKAPQVSTRLRVNLFWMNRNPLVRDKEYFFKLGAARIPVMVEEVCQVLDASTLKVETDKDRVERHDVAECVLRLKRACAFDVTGEIAPTSRFVLVDDYEIWGGGIVREALPDETDAMRSRVLLRNQKWETSRISREDRAEKYNQRPTLILLTGPTGVGKKMLAKALEAQLFAEGKVIYFLGIGNVLYGVDADIKQPGQADHRDEHLRRFAEVANLMLDAGVLVVATAVELTQEDLQIFETTLGPERTVVTWVGEPPTTNIEYHLRIEDPGNVQESTLTIKGYLQSQGIIFRP